jgi:hypothetical protein
MSEHHHFKSEIAEPRKKRRVNSDQKCMAEKVSENLVFCSELTRLVTPGKILSLS